MCSHQAFDFTLKYSKIKLSEPIKRFKNLLGNIEDHLQVESCCRSPIAVDNKNYYSYFDIVDLNIDHRHSNCPAAAVASENDFVVAYNYRPRRYPMPI